MTARPVPSARCVQAILGAALTLTLARERHLKQRRGAAGAGHCKHAVLRHRLWGMTGCRSPSRQRACSPTTKPRFHELRSPRRRVILWLVKRRTSPDRSAVPLERDWLCTPAQSLRIACSIMSCDGSVALPQLQMPTITGTGSFRAASFLSIRFRIRVCSIGDALVPAECQT